MTSEAHYLSSTACPSGEIAIRSILPEGHVNAVVLLLHGATLPSIIFDLSCSQNQPTMMSYLAARGSAVYSLDFRGYGLSSKPDAMDDPIMAGPPLITHQDAANDVYDVLQFIAQRHPHMQLY